MVEMTVTVTGSPAAGSVACGMPFEVEEGVTPSSPGRLEGLTDGTAGGMEDG